MAGKLSDLTFLLEVEFLSSVLFSKYNEEVSGIFCVVVDGTGVLEEGFAANEVGEGISGFSEESGLSDVIAVEDDGCSKGFAVVELWGLTVKSE